MRVSAARSISESPRHAFSPLLFALAVVALSVAAAYLLAGGSKKDVALALAVAAAPVLIYLAIKRPFIFPFGLYAVLVPFNHLSFVEGLGTMTKLAGILASAALIFYVVRTKRWVRPPRVLFAWLAFVTWICASVLWAVNPDGSLYVIGILLQLFALFAVTSIVEVSPRELRIVLALIALGGIAAAAYGGKLFLAGAQTESNRLFLQSAVQGQSVDPNHFSASLLLPIALVLVYALHAPGVFRKLAAFAGLGVLLLGVYASGSRGALVATAAIMVATFWRTRRWLELAFVTVASVVLSLAVKTSIWTRFSVDPSGSGRTSIWVIGAHAFAQRPLFGWGIYNFADAYDQWVLRLYTPIFTKWGRAPHDFVLMTAVELGIVGLALLAWVIVAQARTMRHIDPQDELYAVRVALESAMVGILVVSFFLDTLYWKYTWLVFTAVVLARSASLQTARLPARAVTMTRVVTSS
jgi:O-antigen ligase